MISLCCEAVSSSSKSPNEARSPLAGDSCVVSLDFFFTADQNNEGLRLQDLVRQKDLSLAAQSPADQPGPSKFMYGTDIPSARPTTKAK